MSQQAENTNKPKRWVYLLPLGIFISLCVLFLIGLNFNPRLIPSPLIDKPTPEFSLPRLYNSQQVMQHTDFHGQVSLLNIWATWCPSCKEEHPVLLQIAKTQEVPIYGLFYKDDPQLGVQWLKKHGDPYQANAVDRNGRIGIEWGAYGTPETFIIDQQGIIRYKHVGPISWQDWQQTLLPLISKLKG